MCGGISKLPGARGTSSGERDLNPVPFVFQGDYAGGVTYERGDIVRLFDGAEWVTFRARDRTTVAPFADPGGHWQQVVYNDPPIIMWHAFQLDAGALHPDDPPITEIANVDLDTDPSTTSGSYDLRLTNDQVPSNNGACSIPFDADINAIETAIAGAIGSTPNVSGTPQNYTIEFIDLWAGATLDVTVENNVLVPPVGIGISVSQVARASQLPASLGSIVIGQGVALTEGYAYMKTGTGDNDWTLFPGYDVEQTTIDLIDIIEQEGVGFTSGNAFLNAIRRRDSGLGTEVVDFDLDVEITTVTGDGSGAEIGLNVNEIASGGFVPWVQGPTLWRGVLGGVTAFGIILWDDAVILLDMAGNPILTGLADGDKVVMHGTLWTTSA